MTDENPEKPDNSAEPGSRRTLAIENGNGEKAIGNGNNTSHLFVYASEKAGMQHINKQKLQETLYEMSKDSKYFQNELRRAQQVCVSCRRTNKTKERKIKNMTDEQVQSMQWKCDRQLQTIDSQERDLTKTWIHIDMDMFYAA
ncbi:hypothetical protein RFI_12875, partial [Reticulomyxa filosa]